MKADASATSMLRRIGFAVSIGVAGTAAWAGGAGGVPGSILPGGTPFNPGFSQRCIDHVDPLLTGAGRTRAVNRCRHPQGLQLPVAKAQSSSQAAIAPSAPVAPSASPVVDEPPQPPASTTP